MDDNSQPPKDERRKSIQDTVERKPGSDELEPADELKLDLDSIQAATINPILDSDASEEPHQPTLHFDAIRASVINPDFDTIRAALKPALNFKAIQAVINPAWNSEVIRAAMKPALDFKAMKAAVMTPAWDSDVIRAAMKPALDFKAVQALITPAWDPDTIRAAMKPALDFKAMQAAVLTPAWDSDAMRSAMKPALDFKAMRAAVMTPALDYEVIRAAMKPALDFKAMRAAVMSPTIDFSNIQMLMKSFPAMVSLGASLAAISSLPESQNFKWNNLSDESFLRTVTSAARPFTLDENLADSITSILSKLTDAAEDGVTKSKVAALQVAIESELSKASSSGGTLNFTTPAKWFIPWFIWLVLSYLALQNGVREELCFLQPKIIPGMTSGQLGKAIRSAACEIPLDVLKNHRFVRGDSVNLRTEPRINAETIPIFLSDGAILEVIGDENRVWLHVSVVGQGGVEGWISRKYVRRLTP
ncbi:SH3 domain-containing protein [Pseudomonas salmasensis]|uniref:SH3 domain-containing protein n=1 Tax=Pseudomonas salmasensis TaxID=2745514 RepID=UPI001647BEB7|nr:SH3 domain-containing protein [Pseudomonas salmasensis]QXH77462.1 SH3 domain-containing protein [Pseudomonas salmasensis]